MYNKAIVAVVGAVVAVLAAFNIDVDEQLAVAATTLLTAIAVYLTPNTTA